MMYEVFSHTADIGLRIRSGTLEELFCEAAAGLFSLIVSNLDEVQPRDEVVFSLPRLDGETDYLLFDWINELLFTFDSRRLVLSKFSVQISQVGLQATAWGEPLDATRHGLDHEVKAITYHGLKVVPEAGGWLAEVIVDI
ncbi:MAG TPA: archease [Pirellulales bacterium]|nr:archease [Pirellulales bacterium]